MAKPIKTVKKQGHKPASLTEKPEEFLASQIAYLLDGAEYYDPINPPERHLTTTGLSGGKVLIETDNCTFVATVKLVQGPRPIRKA